VGYSENTKAYRIYLPGSRKVVVQRDVKFMGDRAFRKSREMPSEEQSKYEPLVKPNQQKSRILPRIRKNHRRRRS